MSESIKVQSDMSGNRLTFMRRVTLPGARHHRAIYICSCGVEMEADETHVRTGHTRSCGCLHRETAAKHLTTHGHGSSRGLHRSRTYTTWASMIARCSNPNNNEFHRYGDRGITVSAEWRESFATFLADMGEAPPGKSIDRIDGAGNYERANCRWATSIEQNRNRRDNVRFEFQGENLTLAEIVEAVDTHLTKSGIYQRLQRGETLECALYDHPHPRDKW